MEDITKDYPLLVSLIDGKQLRITIKDKIYICSFKDITLFQNKGGFTVINCIELTQNKYWDAVCIFNLFHKPVKYGDTFSETNINIFGEQIIVTSIYDKKASFYKEEWGDNNTMSIEILGNLYKKKESYF